jgi:hypothetical protein
MTARRVLWPALIAGIAAMLIPAVNADPVKKATGLTLFRPIEIPGMVLQPGNYVIKVPDWVTHPDMVGFYNEDESQLIKLVRTIPRYRLDSADKTVITFEERANGAPDAIKTWFFPGDTWGNEFVYGKAAPLTVAEAAPVAPPAPAPLPVSEVTAPEPQPEPAPAVEAAPAPVEIAEAAEPAAPEAPVAPVEELPKTGSVLPLIALLGAGSLTLGMVLRLRAAKLN